MHSYYSHQLEATLEDTTDDQKNRANSFYPLVVGWSIACSHIPNIVKNEGPRGKPGLFVIFRRNFTTLISDNASPRPNSNAKFMYFRQERAVVDSKTNVAVNSSGWAFSISWMYCSWIFRHCFWVFTARSRCLCDLVSSPGPCSA